MQAIIKIVNLNGGGTLVMYVYVGEQYQNAYYKALGWEDEDWIYLSW